MVLKMIYDNSFPNLSDYMAWKFKSINSSCANLYSGRLLHSLSYEYVNGNKSDDVYEEAKNYINRKCPHISSEEIKKAAAKIQLQYYQFTRFIQNKVNDDIFVAPTRLSRIGNAYIFMKPDLINPKAVYELKFYTPKFPIRKIMKKEYEEGIIYSIAYPFRKIYLVFITISGYQMKRIKPTISEKLRVQGEVEQFSQIWQKNAKLKI